MGEELLRGRSVRRRAGLWRRGRRLLALSGGLWTSLLIAKRSAAECPESGSGAAESRERICGGGRSAGFCDGGRLLLGGLVEAGSVELLLRYCRWTVLREGKTDRWQRLREGCVWEKMLEVRAVC
ncbi:hypothetical protein NC651_027813 [Populus alba x Populus x berolinensis]|nr:hypothetical protein NC651_027813 [Populus alba x Populus x berolinensis]